jgi:hypothetical protein
LTYVIEQKCSVTRRMSRGDRENLQSHDLPVLAPPNPLRGLAHDAEYLASFVNQIDGPVLLVGDQARRDREHAPLPDLSQARDQLPR